MKYTKRDNPITNYFLKFVCLNDFDAPNPPDIVRIFMVLLSSFGSMIALEATFKYGPVFINHDSPIVIPGWAAAVILTCNALQSPFGQPFSLFGGTFLSCIVGISLTKLWMLNPANEDTLWVCGALAAALSSILMSWLQVIHPAACTSALLSAYNPTIRHLGWFYLVIQIVSSIICIGSALIFSNMYAQYPLYWFLPPTLEEKPKIQIIREKGRKKVNPLSPSPSETSSLEGNVQPSQSTSSYPDEDEQPAPLPFLGPEQPPSVAIDERRASVANASMFSISRQPTAQDDYADSPLADVNPQLSAVHPTQSRLARILTASRPAVNRDLKKVFSTSQWLQPMTTSTLTEDKIAAQFPGLKLATTAIISSEEYWFPPSVQFSTVERGTLISIQRRLKGLDAIAKAQAQTNNHPRADSISVAAVGSQNAATERRQSRSSRRSSLARHQTVNIGTVMENDDENDNNS